MVVDNVVTNGCKALTAALNHRLRNLRYFNPGLSGRMFIVDIHVDPFVCWFVRCLPSRLTRCQLHDLPYFPYWKRRAIRHWKSRFNGSLIGQKRENLVFIHLWWCVYEVVSNRYKSRAFRPGRICWLHQSGYNMDKLFYFNNIRQTLNSSWNAWVYQLTWKLKEQRLCLKTKVQYQTNIIRTHIRRHEVASCCDRVSPGYGFGFCLDA